MPVEFTTVINQVESDINTGDLKVIHYSINAVDGEYTDGVYGTIALTSADTLPGYDIVTE